MKRAEIRQKANDLEDTMIDAAGIVDDSIITGLLQDYSVHVWALKHVGDDYPLEQALRIQDIVNAVEQRLPHVSEGVYEEYVVYLKLYSICLETIPRKEVTE